MEVGKRKRVNRQDAKDARKRRKLGEEGIEYWDL